MMAVYRAVTPQTHGQLFWKHSANYNYAAKDLIAVLSANELQAAMVSVPIGFIDNNGAYLPVAIQGLVKGQNLSVSTSGAWTGWYIPAEYWYYPFRMIQNSDGKYVVCVDHNSGLVVEDVNGNPFFNEDGTSTEKVMELVQNLSKYEGDKGGTIDVMEVLQKFDLIEPWPISYDFNEVRYEVTGVFRIDEEKLNRLSGDDMVVLRNCGALLVAYCQRLSMQNIKLLLNHLYARNNTISALQKSSTIGLPTEYSLLDDNENISFENL